MSQKPIISRNFVSTPASLCTNKINSVKIYLWEMPMLEVYF